MTHHSRDQRKEYEFKREMHEDLDDEEASRIEELLAADQKRALSASKPEPQAQDESTGRHSKAFIPAGAEVVFPESNSGQQLRKLLKDHP